MSVKAKSKIVCSRCGREAQPVREIYCKNCATTLVRTGQLARKVVVQTPDTLTPCQAEILTGLMLGDGCLFKAKPHYKPHLAVIRTQDDKDYLFEHYELFKEFCGTPVRDGCLFDKRTGGTTYHSKLVTRGSIAFEKHYQEWYPEGTKIVPKSLELSPLILAIFFADDGHCRFASSGQPRLQLSTECFLKTDIEFLKSKIESFCNIQMTITASNRLCAYGDHAQKFYDIISTFMPLSMKRKMKWLSPARNLVAA